MSRFIHTVTLWLWGGFLYYAIEQIFRGHSHPSMFVLGGVCFLLIGGINNFFSWSMGLVKQAVIGAVMVTVVELVSGLILNRWLDLSVWDYSEMSFNLLGQICLLYSLAWIALSCAGILVDDYLRWKLFNEEIPQYRIFDKKQQE